MPLALLCLAAPAAAQTLDINLDAAVGSGVTMGTGDGEALSRRTPFYLDVDAGFVFDRDFETEWGLGITAQLEDAPAVALTPQVRLVRPLSVIEVYAGAGIPVFVTPFTRVGAELGGGVLYALHERFALLAGGQVDLFFAGSDLPEGSLVIMFNLGVGGRVRF